MPGASGHLQSTWASTLRRQPASSHSSAAFAHVRPGLGCRWVRRRSSICWPALSSGSGCDHTRGCWATSARACRTTQPGRCRIWLKTKLPARQPSQPLAESRRAATGQILSQRCSNLPLVRLLGSGGVQEGVSDLCGRTAGRVGTPLPGRWHVGGCGWRDGVAASPGGGAAAAKHTLARGSMCRAPVHR